MRLVILHTNDFHGTLTPAKADYIASLKTAETLYFDTGDCIKTGNLGIPLKTEKAWELLARAGCDAGVLGNRETHVLPAAFRAKLEGHVHPLLCANLRFKSSGERHSSEDLAKIKRPARVMAVHENEASPDPKGPNIRAKGFSPGTSERLFPSPVGTRQDHVLLEEVGLSAEAAAKEDANQGRGSSLLSIERKSQHPLPSHAIFNVSGLKVGVFGIMAPMVTERMATKGASAYLWDPPLPVAKLQIAELRDQVDCLIALTHIGYKQDLVLAETCPEIDVILGGHSHTVISPPWLVGKTWICQGGSHGEFVGKYEWADGRLGGGLVPMAK